jgi:hypothetical protein
MLAGPPKLVMAVLAGRCGGESRSWVATRSTILGAGFGPIAAVNLTRRLVVFLTPNA